MAHVLPSTVLNSCDGGLLYCMFEWANNVTYSLFTVFTLLAFCVILFMATARLGNVRAYGWAGFAGMIGGIWFATMGLMDWSLASAFIINGIVALSMMILSEK